jgi:hypothetical protein
MGWIWDARSGGRQTVVVIVRGSEKELKELKELEPAATAVHLPPNVNPREEVGFPDPCTDSDIC